MEKGKVLFYGAGEHAAMIYRHAVRKCAAYGEPAAFIDRDVYKQGHDLFGLPVISWEDAQKRYGDDFFIYVTGNEKAAPEILGFLQEQGIQKERIINWEPVEKRLGCWANGSLWGIAPSANKITYTCCCPSLSDFVFHNLADRLEFSHDTATAPDSVQKAIQIFLTRTELEDSGGLCTDCTDYKIKYYYKERRFHKIHFGGVGYCNFRCRYCLYNYPEYYPKNTYEPYDIYPDILKQIEQTGYTDDDTIISIATGEFSISEAGRRFISMALEYNHPIMILTNAYIFSQEAAQALDHSGIILCSVDAGTPESFQKVKGVDGFDRVSENLQKYAEHGPVSLKYILLEGANDSLEDLEGFIQLADKVAVRVSMTRDYFAKGIFPEQTLKFMARFVSHFRKQGKLNMDLSAVVRLGEAERLSQMLEEL